MKKENFEELLESVREAGAILRGEIKPSREFHFDQPHARRNPERQFAICVKTDDPALLIPQKIYRVELLGDNLVKVADEEGEAAIYPAECFILIDVTKEIESALLNAAP